MEALVVIDAIKRRGSFAAAAAELDRVPSALSYTMQKLEETLGIGLFRRQGRRAVLTPAGEALASGAARLLVDAGLLTAQVKQIATGWEPRLSVAFDTTVDREPVWTAVKKLYEVHPRVDLNITEQVLGGVWEALFDDQADLIIGAVENLPDQYKSARQGIRVLPWKPITTVFIAAPTHPVCQAPQPLALETMQAHRGVVIADTSSRLRALHRGQFQKGNVLYVDNMQEKISAHVKGIGVGLLPEHLAAPYLREGRLVKLDTETASVPEPTSLAFRAAHKGKALGFLVDQLVKQVDS
jgi:DNA-binding transcriptional LysR family regulator